MPEPLLQALTRVLRAQLFAALERATSARGELRGPVEHVLQVAHIRSSPSTRNKLRARLGARLRDEASRRETLGPLADVDLHALPADESVCARLGELLTVDERRWLRRELHRLLDGPEAELPSAAHKDVAPARPAFHVSWRLWHIRRVERSEETVPDEVADGGASMAWNGVMHELPRRPREAALTFDTQDLALVHDRRVEFPLVPGGAAFPVRHSVIYALGEPPQTEFPSWLVQLSTHLPERMERAVADWLAGPGELGPGPLHPAIEAIVGQAVGRAFAEFLAWAGTLLEDEVIGLETFQLDLRHLRLHPTPVWQVRRYVSADATYEATASWMVRPAWNRNLVWYRHLGRADGTPRWAAESTPALVSWDWRHAFSAVAPSGVMYASSSGVLYWYRHLGAATGEASWANVGVPVEVRDDVGRRPLLAAPDGVLYTAATDGALRWYRHFGHLTGAPEWAPDSGVVLGPRLGAHRLLACGPEGAIYAVTSEGDLLRYRHLGAESGRDDWAEGGEPERLGAGWSVAEQLCVADADVLYSVDLHGRLRWHGNAARGDLPFSAGRVVGRDWASLRVGVGPEGAIYRWT